MLLPNGICCCAKKFKSCAIVYDIFINGIQLKLIPSDCFYMKMEKVYGGLPVSFFLLILTRGRGEKLH